MVGSLVKISAFILLVALASYVAALVMNVDGLVRFAIAGREYSTSPITLVLAIAAMIPIIWILFFLIGLFGAFVSFVIGDQTALTRYLNKNRERRGYEALADSMVAMSSGEPNVAADRISLADRYLKRPELTGLLAAQAAERTGDDQKAMEIYKRMLDNDKTRFSGLAGILKHKLEEGKPEVAKKLAEKAFAIKPRHEEIQNILFKLQTLEGDWSGARKTLGFKQKQRVLPRDVCARREAVLSLAEAIEFREEGDAAACQRTAAHAVKLAPGLVPAAVMAAELRLKAGERRAASRILTRAWNIEPHPDLAKAFAAIEPDEDFKKRIKRFRRLVAKEVNHPESCLLMAELAIAEGDFGLAREEIGNTPVDAPTVRSLVLMAAIERGEGASESKVKSLMTQAVTAPRDPQWVCNSCMYTHPEWAAVCSNCDGFDTLSWQSVREVDHLHPSLTEVLPRMLLPVEAVEASVSIQSDSDNLRVTDGQEGERG